MSELTHEKALKLPTLRRVAVLGEQIAWNGIDNLRAVIRAREDLVKALDPIAAHITRGIGDMVTDREALENELLQQMEGADALSAKLIEAEAALATEKACVASYMQENERLQHGFDSARAAYAEVVVERNKAQIACEERDDKIRELSHDLWNATELQKLSNGRLNSYATWTKELLTFLRKRRVKLPEQLENFTIFLEARKP